jgi:hypothetical protein
MFMPSHNLMCASLFSFASPSCLKFEFVFFHMNLQFIKDLKFIKELSYFPIGLGPNSCRGLAGSTSLPCAHSRPMA